MTCVVSMAGTMIYIYIAHEFFGMELRIAH